MQVFSIICLLSHPIIRSSSLSIRLAIFVFVLRPQNSHILNSFARTDVAALNGGLRGSETQTNVLVPSSATLARSGGLGLGLRVLEDVRLLLESTLRLDGQLGGHGCGWQ